MIIFNSIMKTVRNGSYLYFILFIDSWFGNYLPIAHYILSSNWMVSGVVFALQMCSHLARNSEVYFSPLRETFSPSRLGSLLVQLNSAVRAKTCNLIGNLCRHSASWYDVLMQPVYLLPSSKVSSVSSPALSEQQQHPSYDSLLAALIHCCADADDSTRKFACFAGKLFFFCCCHLFILNLRLFYVFLVFWAIK